MEPHHRHNQFSWIRLETWLDERREIRGGGLLMTAGCDGTIDPVGIVHSLRVFHDAWDLQSWEISLFTSVIAEKASA